MITVSSQVKSLIKSAIRKGEAIDKLFITIYHDLALSDAIFQYTHPGYEPQNMTFRRVRAEWGREAKLYRIEQAQRAKLLKQGIKPHLERKFLEALRNGASLDDACTMVAESLREQGFRSGTSFPS